MASETRIIVDRFPEEDKNADEWAPYIEDKFGRRVALLEISEDMSYVINAARYWSKYTGIPFRPPDTQLEEER